MVAFNLGHGRKREGLIVGVSIEGRMVIVQEDGVSPWLLRKLDFAFFEECNAKPGVAWIGHRVWYEWSTTKQIQFKRFGLKIQSEIGV